MTTETNEPANDVTVVSDVELKKLTEENELVKSINRELTDKLRELPALKAFVGEISAFHRKALIPLTTMVEQLLKAASSQSQSDAHKAAAKQMEKFLKSVLDRSKFYEGSKFVIEQRKAQAIEKQKLETKVEAKPEEAKNESPLNQA